MPLIPLSPDYLILKSYTEHNLEALSWWEPCAVKATFAMSPPSETFEASLILYSGGRISFLHSFGDLAAHIVLLCLFPRGGVGGSKAAGADGHESLYPWFPQQDTVSVVS